jgi:preprotein translocase subunit SecG
MTDKVLLASNTLVMSVIFFACSQVVFAFSRTKNNAKQHKKPNQNKTKTAQKQHKNIKKQYNSTKQHKTAHNSTKAQ